MSPEGDHFKCVQYGTKTMDKLNTVFVNSDKQLRNRIYLVDALLPEHNFLSGNSTVTTEKKWGHRLCVMSN